MNALINVGFFLVNLFFSLCLFVLWLRIFLKFYRISNLHPVHKLINHLTRPLMGPLDHLVHRKNAKPVRYDVLCLVVIIVFELIKFLLLGLIVFGTWLSIIDLLNLTIGDLFILPINLFFYMILLQVIMSWVNPRWHNPIAEVIHIMTKPLLQLGHQLLPNVSGFDFSPFIVLIFLKVLTLFISGLMPTHLLAWL